MKMTMCIFFTVLYFAIPSVGNADDSVDNKYVTSNRVNYLTERLYEVTLDKQDDPIGIYEMIVRKYKLGSVTRGFDKKSNSFKVKMLPSVMEQVKEEPYVVDVDTADIIMSVN